MKHSKKHKKTFAKEDYLEKYEKDFILFGLFAFIILSVVSFVFLMPGLYGFYDSIYLKNESENNKNKYVQIDQAPSEVNYKSGIIYLEEKNYSLALEFFEKAIDEEPENINYLIEYALTNYRLKNYNQSIEAYKKIIAIDQNSASSYNSIGNIYWIMENYNEAENNFKKAIEIDSSLISSYNNYALMLDEIGQVEKAKEILQQGIELNSENIELKLIQRIIQ